MSVKINPDQSTVSLLRRSVIKMERIPAQRENSKIKPAWQPKEAIRKVLSDKIEQAVKLHREKSAEALKRSLAELKEAFTLFNVAIKFDREKPLDSQLVVKLVRKDSGEVVYQIPPEYIMEIRRMAEFFPGLYLDKSV
jgi:uncharacterized FlaG/YvyC family protein